MADISSTFGKLADISLTFGKLADISPTFDEFRISGPRDGNSDRELADIE